MTETHINTSEMSNKTELTLSIMPVSRRAGMEETIGSPFARKERMRCMFCGGEQCKRCGINAYMQQEKPAIPNLHSSWINDSILAMQRPNDALFDNFGVLESFRKAHITAVFNLTEPGEHPYCGTGLIESSGFPYTPEKLMRAGIKHFNFHWPDMTAPTIAKMMEIAYIGTAEINSGGKIAVHCHAGFGRTGMAIACILIFKDQVESGQVITFVRNRRPGSIQTATQDRFIRKFEKSYRFLMQCFPTKDSLELSNSGDALTRSASAGGGAGAGSGSGGKGEDGHSFSFSATSSSLTAGISFASPLSPTSTKIDEHTNTSLYLKTIQQSVKDQQYLLSPIDLSSRIFQHVHKIVYYTTMALTALCNDHVQLAHLGITGLSKLLPKENTSHKFTSNLSKHNMSVLMNAPSYMVATNSMSQGLEETILTDIKIELNSNKWTRFMSVADVVAISLKLGDSVKRLTKINSTIPEEKSPAGSSRSSPAPQMSTAIPGIAEGGRMVSRGNSMFRTNSFKETSDADYNKSKRVGANIMAQLLIDWLETRQNCVFDGTLTMALQELWLKHYPKFGELGWATQAWKDLRTRTRTYVAFEGELLALLRTSLDRYRLQVLGSVVAMFHRIHCAGCDHNNEEGQNEAPTMDTLVALRLSIALMHGRKQQHLLVRNRALNMELVKIFMLKHADTEPVIINNITFMHEHALTICNTLGAALVTTLEVLVRTLLLLQEISWEPDIAVEDKVYWREDTVQKFVPS